MATITRNTGAALLVLALILGFSPVTPGRSQEMTLLEALGFLGAANDFNVFVLNEMTAGNTDATGRLAVGGTAILNNYAVANGQHGAVDFGGDNAIFGGDLVLQGNLNMNSGSVVLGGSMSGPGTINFNSNQGSAAGSLKQGSPIDFAAAATELQELAATIATWPPTPSASAKVVNGNELVISSSEPGLVVVNVRIEDLNNPNSQVRFDVPADATVIVNVVGSGTVNWPQWNYFLPGSITGSNILWNLPEVTEMTSSYAGIKGSVLAPKATFNFLNGHIDGQLIVNNLYGAGGSTSGGQLGESHYYPFLSPSGFPDPTEEPTAEATPAPTEDPTQEATPAPTEDPSQGATPTPTEDATPAPTEEVTPAPTEEPTEEATQVPTEEPTQAATPAPTEDSTHESTPDPTTEPTEEATEVPTEQPTDVPTGVPTDPATEVPTDVPTQEVTATSTAPWTEVPTEESTVVPTDPATEVPTEEPTSTPTQPATEEPTSTPTDPATELPTEEPTVAPTDPATEVATEVPTTAPTDPATEVPTGEPTEAATEYPTHEVTVTPDSPLAPETTEPGQTAEPGMPQATPIVEESVETPAAPTKHPTVAQLPATGNQPQDRAIGGLVAVSVGMAGLAMLITGEVVRRNGGWRREH